MVDRSSPQALQGSRGRRHRAHWIGQGEDTLVLAHGFGTDQSSWQPLVATLAKAYRILLFDLPGASGLIPDDYDPRQYSHLSRYADDLIALLDEAGVTRCNYVGHSVSGMIGALAAIAAPELFRHLILINSSPRYLDDAGYTGGFTPEDLNSLYESIGNDYETWVSGFSPLVLGTGLPDPIARFSQGLLSMRPDMTLAVARVIFESDVRDFIELVPVPVTLMHSRRDFAVPVSVGFYLNRRIPASKLIWMGTVGHVPQLTDADQLLVHLQAALKRL